MTLRIILATFGIALLLLVGGYIYRLTHKVEVELAFATNITHNGATVIVITDSTTPLRVGVKERGSDKLAYFQSPRKGMLHTVKLTGLKEDTQYELVAVTRAGEQKIPDTPFLTTKLPDNSVQTPLPVFGKIEYEGEITYGVLVAAQISSQAISESISVPLEGDTYSLDLAYLKEAGTNKPFNGSIHDPLQMHIFIETETSVESYEKTLRISENPQEVVGL